MSYRDYLLTDDRLATANKLFKLKTITRGRVPDALVFSYAVPRALSNTSVFLSVVSDTHPEKDIPCTNEDILEVGYGVEGIIDILLRGSAAQRWTLEFNPRYLSIEIKTSDWCTILDICVQIRIATSENNEELKHHIEVVKSQHSSENSEKTDANCNHEFYYLNATIRKKTLIVNWRTNESF